MPPLPSQPVLLIGPPRCGTKLLRELLLLHPDVRAPQVELEHRWTHGNPGRFSSAISPEELTPRLAAKIRKSFQRLERPGSILVLKNVANCLRLPYVRHLFPQSPFITIVRDGVDATCSIRERWRTPLDLRYILRNRILPVREVPRFALRQARMYAQKLLSGAEHTGWWGPRIPEGEELLQTRSLLEVCATQWARCAAGLRDGLADLPDERKCAVRYETLVEDPAGELGRVLTFLGLTTSPELSRQATATVSARSVGRGARELDAGELERVDPILRPLQEELGYSAPRGPSP